MHFLKKFRKVIREKNSHLCVGLDSDRSKLPKFLAEYDDSVYTFNRLIIDCTKDIVSSYKLNIAFYEREAGKGWETLQKTVKLISEDTISILDAKRGDIENTTEMYAQTYFDEMGFDAVTAQPYMGSDSVRPFIRRKNKFVFLLVLTSNYGSKDFQLLKIGKKQLYQVVIEKAREWNDHKIGFVVGANYTKELSSVSKSFPDTPILIPGIGAQKNSLERTLTSIHHNQFIINQSRSIIYSANKAANEDEFQKMIRESTRNANEEINSLLKSGR